MNSKLTKYWPVALFLLLAHAASATDLALKIAVSKHEPKRGDTVAASIRLLNQDRSDVTSIAIKIGLVEGLRLLSPAVSIGTYDSQSGVWCIQQMPATLPSAELHLFLVAEADGPLPIRAEIIHQNEPDGDSRPGNEQLNEDDLAFGYFSVPIVFCGDAPIRLTAKALPGFTGYQWFRDGMPLPGATNRFLDITQPGKYTCRVNEAGGNEAASTPVIVRKNPELKLKMPENQPVCAGETLLIRPEVVSGTPPYSFRWENDRGIDIQKSLKANTDFLLTATVTDGMGCQQKTATRIRVIDCK